MSEIKYVGTTHCGQCSIIGVQKHTSGNISLPGITCFSKRMGTHVYICSLYYVILKQYVQCQGAIYELVNMFVIIWISISPGVFTVWFNNMNREQVCLYLEYMYLVTGSSGFNKHTLCNFIFSIPYTHCYCYSYIHISDIYA